MKTIAPVLATMGLAAIAFAAPPKKLSAAELKKIVDARRAAEPDVDHAKAARCQPMLGRYPDAKDAKPLLARAARIRFRIGDDERATKDVALLHADANTLCDSIHPIEMPKSPP